MLLDQIHKYGAMRRAATVEHDGKCMPTEVMDLIAREGTLAIQGANSLLHKPKEVLHYLLDHVKEKGWVCVQTLLQGLSLPVEFHCTDQEHLMHIKLYGMVTVDVAIKEQCVALGRH